MEDNVHSIPPDAKRLIGFFQAAWAKVIYFVRFLLLLSHHYLFTIYHFLKIPSLIHWVKFLFHRYSTSQFSPLNAKENVTQLIQWQKKERLESDSKGKLRRLTSTSQKVWFMLKNVLLMGAPESRVKRVVYYTFLTLTIEIYNPFDKQILGVFLQRKIQLIERLLKKFESQYKKKWFAPEVRYHLRTFHMSSLMQGRIIDHMHKAVKRQKEPPIIKDAKEALKKGLYPILVSTGCSGAYWMRSTTKEIAGLFKPFDEEIQAPNNPIGPVMQGALGLRKTRIGVRVGEAAHREVAAYLVDQFFEFGIVPRTYYASFSHQAFYSAREDRFSRRSIKTKYGSFQEFVEGFTPIYKASKEEKAKVSLEEFQLLVVLDVIMGNVDRNTGNILVGGEKLAAIDHGLVLPDVPEDLSCWYWEYFEQGKEPLFPAFIKLLSEFPYEELSKMLRKKCLIHPPCFARMRERIALFREGILAGFTPVELIGLMKHKHLVSLLHLDATLTDKAKEIVSSYTPDHL